MEERIDSYLDNFSEENDLDIDGHLENDFSYLLSSPSFVDRSAEIRDNFHLLLFLSLLSNSKESQFPFLLMEAYLDKIGNSFDEMLDIYRFILAQNKENLIPQTLSSMKYFRSKNEVKQLKDLLRAYLKRRSKNIIKYKKDLDFYWNNN